MNMRNLSIKNTNLTPSVNFRSNGELRIEGRSIPEDPESFYEPLFQWINEYFQDPKDSTRLDIQLEYINSGSSKFIMSFLKIFKDRFDEGKNISINWFYEEDDENLQELGVHYKTLLKIPFNLVEIM